MANKAYQRVYTHLEGITKATVSLRAKGVSNDELAMVAGKLAQVVRTKGDMVTLQIFSGTEGIPTDAEVTFLGEPPMLKVSDQLSGRFFNAYGHPIDGGPEIDGEERPIGGPSVNPYKRRQPSQLIPTGIAGIDLNNTLVSGQKIPFFADPDQPYNQVMAAVALRADVDKITLGRLEGMPEEQVIVVREAHSAEDDLVDVGADRHVGHDLVVGLVRIGEERNLLAGDDRIVEVDAGDAGRNQLGRLAALVRIDGRTADLADFAFRFRTAVDRMPVGVEETPGKLFGDLEGRRFAEEGHFRIGRDSFRSGEHLQGDEVALCPDHLGEFAMDDGQLVVGDAFRPEGHGRLGDVFKLCIDSLVCFS